MQLRPGVRISWASRTRFDARAYEQTLDALRLSKRDDLIDALARNKKLLPRLHQLHQQETITRIRLQDLLAPAGGHSIGEIAKEFFQYMLTPGSRSRYRTAFAASTAALYQTHINRFIDWLEDGAGTPMESITSHTLSAFHRYRVDHDKISPVGADRSASAVQALFSWATDGTRRSGGALTSVRPLSHRKTPNNEVEARALTPDELTRIRQHIPDEVWPIFEVTVNLGLRISECLFLRTTDILLTEQIVRVLPHNDRYLKTPSSKRDIPFHHSLAPVLKKALLNAKGEYLWGKNWRHVGTGGKSGNSRAGYYRLARVWSRASKAAGISCSIHDLRHTYGSRLADSGVAPREIAALMGHKSVSTTERYWKTKEDLDRKKEAVMRLGASVTAPTLPPNQVPSEYDSPEMPRLEQIYSKKRI